MVLIAVHGAASRSVPVERGTVTAVVGLEHDDRETVVARVAALHERLVDDAKTCVLRGEATRWGSEQVRVRPERRYLKDSETYRWIQVASAEVRVRFRDLAALSGWLDRVGSIPGVSIDGIEWTLTERTRDEVQREVRIEAVRDATARAEAYGSAIGAAGVRLQALWEPGLRPGAAGHLDGEPVLRAMAASGVSPVELRPEDVEVGAAVTADFLVLEAD